MPDPDWHTDDFPELRPGPPWVMQEMIAAQPEVVEALLSSAPPETSEAAEAIAAALERNLPVTSAGAGPPSTPRTASPRCCRPPSNLTRRRSCERGPR